MSGELAFVTTEDKYRSLQNSASRYVIGGVNIELEQKQEDLQRGYRPSLHSLSSSLLLSLAS